MTHEEYQRLKEAEKEHLREKKRLRKRLAALKKRARSQGLVQTMKEGAQRLLRETESLVDTLRTQGARSEARLEVAEDGLVDDLTEAEEELRKERAESLVRQYKAASNQGATRSARSEEQKRDAVDAETDSAEEGPDKTIGRMRTPRSDSES